MELRIPLDAQGLTLRGNLYRACNRVRFEVPPQDRQDIIARVSPNTWDDITRELPPDLEKEGLPDVAAAPALMTVFGLDIQPDARVEDGVLHVWVENEMDRAIRRAQERGQTVNVVRTVPFDPASWPAPAPTPTARALLGHWRKKLSRGKRK